MVDAEKKSVKSCNGKLGCLGDVMAV